MERRWLQPVAALALAVAVLLGARYAYDRLWRTTIVTREGDGAAVSKVVFDKLDAARDLRVGRLTGTVQGTACVSSAWGILQPCRVYKAPFSVDYFVPMARLRRTSFRWNEAQHLLLVDTPDVIVGDVNVDDSRTSYDETTGIFVTRGASAELHRKSSASAHGKVAARAIEPKLLRQVRDNARRALEAQFALPLRAAGLRADVEVVFSDERDRGVRETWDMSAPLSSFLSS